MTGTVRLAVARAGTRSFAAAAVCVALGLAVAPPAAADQFSDGQWYAANFHLADNHTVADGTGVTVAMIDGPVDPSVPALAGAKIQPAAATSCVASDGRSASTATGPDADHATKMATMLVGQGNGNAVGVAPGATLLTYNIGYLVSPDSTSTKCLDAGGNDVEDDALAAAVSDAVAKGARVVSMSFTTFGNKAGLETAVLLGMRKGVVFVASTNDNAELGDRLNPPASYNGVVAVNGIDSSGKLLDVSASGDPQGPLVVASGPGGGLSLGGFAADGSYDPADLSNGSSPATAFVAGALAVTLSKYPQATGNQLIQSLARNTGGQQHEIQARALDGYGYGVVSLTSMLENDPTTYPDENPTLRDGAYPSTADILQGSSSSGSPSGSTSSAAGSGSAAPSTSSSPVAASDDGSSTGLFVGLGIAALVLVVALVLVAVLLSRRGRRGRTPPPGAGPPPSTVGGAW